jgi:beta-lactamase regulating signal transducer with metallopeptidase domain
MIRFALLPETATALGVLLTYLVHGLAWFAGAWLLVRPALGLSPAACNRVWRLALVGPLLSTALALAAPGGLHLDEVELAPPVVVSDPPRHLDVTVDLDLDADARGSGEALAVRLSTPPSPSSSSSWASAWPASIPPLVWLLVFAPVAGLAVGRLAMLVTRMRRFERVLSSREAADDVRAHELLSDLALAAVDDGPVLWPVRLTVSRHAGSPMALGRREICLPVRALEELDDRALAAVLAHELAHLERRDNAWLALACAIEAALFLQPLNRRIRRHMQETAELACDERAVQLVGGSAGETRVALARSIAAVAAWGLGPARGVPVSAMVHEPGGQSAIVRRVAALLHARAPGGPVRRWLGRVAPLLLVAAGLLAPTVGERNVILAAPPPIVIDPPKAAAAASPFFWNRAREPRASQRRRPPRVRASIAIPLPPLPALPPVPIPGAGTAQLDARYEREMEAWGEEVGRRMEEWGERFGRHMERWGEDMGRWGEDMGRWGEDMARRKDEWARRMHDKERRKDERERREEAKERVREEMERRREQEQDRREQLRERQEEERERRQEEMERRREEEQERRERERDRQLEQQQDQQKQLRRR